MARSAVATENFSGTLGNFTQVNPTWADLAITSGVVHGDATGADSGGEVGAAVYSGAGTFSNDQYSSLVIGGLSWQSLAFNIGVIVRASTDTNANRDYYQVVVASDQAGPNYTTILSKVVNGTRTQLHSASAAWANGDRIELEAEGTTIRVMKNGTALGGSFTQTDSALSTGKPGIAGSGDSTHISGDDWEGGDLTSGDTLMAQGLC